jgi:hypothetical protein
MKILMVAIPNHHFFQWVNQLKNSGYQIYWFDITDGGPRVEKIQWIDQIKGWKLKWNFPLRHSIKSKFPRVYEWIQKYNERNVAIVFQNLIQKINPDIVHCFEMNLSGLPLLNVLKRHNNIKLIYSSWGSDLFFYKEMGILKSQVEQFLTRVNYLITDCKRDYNIAVQNGFKNNFLGVFPGNGGIVVNRNYIFDIENRSIILIKGYDDGVGKAIKVIEAIALLPKVKLENIQIIIYSADQSVKQHILKSNDLQYLNIKILERNAFIDNEELLRLMGKSILHIANSISDGMPNALLEAIAMGAFPIQSNPGQVTEEIIKHDFNGYLINNPLGVQEISNLIEKALCNHEMRKQAQIFNVDFMYKNYNRSFLENKIIQLYHNIYN